MKKIMISILIAVVLFTGCSKKPSVIITHNYSSDNVETEATVVFDITSDIPQDTRIEHQWAVSSGRVISTSGSSMSWKAPEKPGPVMVSVHISSDKSPDPLVISRELIVVAPRR